MDPLLRLQDFSAAFDTARGLAPAVDGVSFDLAPGEVFGLVGESGCGKTVLSLGILGLIPRPGRISGGRAFFGGRELTAMSQEELRALRGAEIAMIFQEPMTALNPVMRVGVQLAEPLLLHKGLDKRQAEARCLELLEQVGLPGPRAVLRAYPHELSGGMRQRVMIAMALGCGPRLLIADEPTTALDVTIQKQILELLSGLAAERGLAMLFITHNLGVVAQTCHRVGVMYAGRLVEVSPVEALFAKALHPYTQGLMASLPRLGSRHERLTPVAGTVPPLTALPSGCHFHPRCPFVMDRCRREIPPVFRPEPGREARCWLHAEGGRA
ncbi:ABC transporter ATP-binding protein [Fundidesulfovibrio agrisoli]|uniref:ABC transporter ATP-binding protein n=1 Tax=Fundidesulfovibrio agrisoli TaxID=2922717 RepID=UPI001FAE6C7E|nr:ABC transporter ATP-binding protein [Fundidesulfovibrio agrisoli]